MSSDRAWKPRLWLLATFSLIVLTGCNDDDVVIPETKFTLQLLHLSDMDGSDATALNSVANMSGLIQKYRAEYPNNTLTVSSGDNYIPGPRFNAADDVSMRTLLGREGLGRADIAFVNELGIQASAIGNHELDLGTKVFAEMVKPASNGWLGARFPYLAYNVDFAGDSETASLKTDNGQLASAIPAKLTGWVKVSVGGETIGIIGASSPVFASITSPGGLKFLPVLTSAEPDVTALAAEIQKGVDQIKAAGINKIVLLAHMQQISIEQSLASKLKDVDIIVAGGSNTLLANSGDALRAGDTSKGAYPLWFKSASGEPVAVVNTDADYKYLGRFVAPFDDKGLLIKERVEYPKTGAKVTSETSDSAGSVTPMTIIQQIRDGIKAVLAAKDGNVFGKTSVFLEGRRALVRNQETNFGNLTADANLWYAKLHDASVQISLKNGGGIRSEIGEVVAAPGATSGATLAPPKANPDAGRAEGEISQLAVETALKFNNKLWVLDVTAAQLKALLEHSVAALGSQGRFPQVGGMSFSYDPTRTAQVSSGSTVTTPGERIRSLKVGATQVVVNGALVDPSATFRLVTLNFLAGGGDGYPFPAEASMGNLVKLDVSMTDSSAGGAASTSGATLGSEQDAFLKHMKALYGASAFSLADTPEEQDARIQNLSKRSDSVL
jgi:5'-nucleotidase/UDP-sugar diphosphatase